MILSLISAISRQPPVETANVASTPQSSQEGTTNAIAIVYSLVPAQFPGPEQQEFAMHDEQQPKRHESKKGKKMKNSYTKFCCCTFFCGKQAS